MSEVLDDLINDEGVFSEMTSYPRFRNEKNLTISSIHTTMLGKNSCGRKYCITPTIHNPFNTSVIQVDGSNCQLPQEH